MALSLILRNANKVQGYSCLFRGTSTAFKNTENFSVLTNKAVFNASRCLAPLGGVKENSLTQNVRCMSSDHRMLWTVERVFSAALIPVLPLTILMPCEILDNVASIIVVLHLHWGLEAIAVDYMRPIIFGDAISKISRIAVYVISAITLGGLFSFNYNDIGIGCAIKKLWAVNSG